jgi:hypothetical protein
MTRNEATKAVKIAEKAYIAALSKCSPDKIREAGARMDHARAVLENIK